MYFCPISTYMRYRVLSFVLFLSLLIQLSSCRKNDSGAKYVPKEALGVFSMSIPNLMKKISWAALSDSRIFSELLKGSKDTTFNIKETGIDASATIFGYGLSDQRIESKFKFFLVVPLKNQKKFEAYLKDLFPEGVLKTGAQKLMIIDESSCLIWNKDIAIAGFIQPNEYGFQDLKEQVEILKQDLLRSLSLKEEESLHHEKRYLSLIKENNDFSFWFNYDAFRKSMSQDEWGSAGAILSAQKNLVSDTYLSGGLNFLKGKISIEGKYFYNASSKALANIFTNVQYNNDLIKRIPGEQMNLLAHFQFNPNGLPVLLDTMGMMPLTRMALKQNGFEIEELSQLFQGDFLFTIVDFDFEKLSHHLADQMEGNIGQAFYQSALSFKIKDRNAFEKLINFAVEKQLIGAEPDGMYKIEGNFLAYKDDYAVLSDNKKTVFTLINNKETKDWQIPQNINNNPFAFYVDIQNSTRDFKNILSQNETSALFLRLAENITASGGKIKGDYSPFSIEINLQNKDENSLVQLLLLKSRSN